MDILAPVFGSMMPRLALFRRIIIVIEILLLDETVARDWNIDLDRRLRRLRRPAYVSTAGPPDDPARPPDSSRDPNPTVGCVLKPASIMTCGPSPWVIRFPCPALVCIFPVAICIGTPIRSDDRRRPHQPVAAKREPSPIRRQIVIERVDAIDICSGGYRFVAARLSREQGGTLGLTLRQNQNNKCGNSQDQ